MTPERADRVARWAIAAMASVDAVRFAIHLTASLPLVAVSGALAAVALLFRFAQRNDRVAALLAMTALAILGETWSLAGPNGPERNYYASGAVLLGYLAGALFSKWSGTADRFPIAGARAALAGIYMSSAITKIRASHLDWISAAAVQSTIAALAPVNGWRARLAGMVVDDPAISATLATATFVLELGAFSLMARGRIRQIWAALLIAMHAAIAILTPIVYLGNVVLLAAIGIAIPPEPADAAALERTTGRRPILRFAAVVAAVVAAVAITGMGTGKAPQRDWIHAAILPPQRPCRVPAIGALAAGSALDGWRISAIERTPDQAVVRIRQRSGEVALVIAPAGPVKRPTPFDRADVSIWYTRTPIALQSFESAGIALADRVTAKGQPGEGAASLRRWLAEPCHERDAQAARSTVDGSR